MDDELPEPVIEAITEFNEREDVTLSDYLKPQRDETRNYAVGTVGAGTYGLLSEPASAVVAAPAGALGGYIYAKAKKHRQGRRACRNSWDNLRGYLSGQAEDA